MAFGIQKKEHPPEENKVALSASTFKLVLIFLEFADEQIMYPEFHLEIRLNIL